MHPLLALGTAALDIKTRLSRHPLPTTDVPGRITLKAGGVARNLAENLARLNVPIVFAGILGADPQAQVLIELTRAAGVTVFPIARSVPHPTDFPRLKLPDVLPTATLNVMLAPDNRQIGGAFSGDILDALQPDDLDQVRDLIEAAPAVLCDSGLPVDVLIRLRELLPEDTFFYCNPGSVALAPRIEPLLDRLDLIDLQSSRSTSVDASENRRSGQTRFGGAAAGEAGRAARGHHVWRARPRLCRRITQPVPARPPGQPRRCDGRGRCTGRRADRNPPPRRTD